MKEIVDVATKISYSIWARSLQRWLFYSHLEKAEYDYSELLLYTNVRWLSCREIPTKILIALARD